MSALTINIISVMSRLHSQKAKALLYSLPFPITIALIGSRGIASSLSLTGLMLTTTFLWGCFYLHFKRGWRVLYADVFLSVVYVMAAYLLSQYLRIPFWLMAGMYGLAWLGLMVFFRSIVFTYSKQPAAQTNIWIKAGIIFVVAFLLFSAHQYLAAFIVTFPYNGVFAVYENRAGLLPQAALFTRNSLALAGYFVANYLVGNQYPAITRYAASWLAFGVLIIFLNKYVRLKVEAICPAGLFTDRV